MDDLIELYIGHDNVKTIIEAGACDCKDTLLMQEKFKNAHSYCFECNPTTLPLCREVAKNNQRITLIEKAVSEIDGDITFYPINTWKTVTTHKNGNPGASSMFKASGEYPIETYVQDEIKVPSITLKTACSDLNIREIDLMWLDAQGAELSILKGMGDMIDKVKIIKTEVEFKNQYEGAPLFDDVLEFLESKGFRFVRFLEKFEWFGDAIFIKESL